VLICFSFIVIIIIIFFFGVGEGNRIVEYENGVGRVLDPLI
jgi:hypothetical protein